jgi:hypothetical protein
MLLVACDGDDPLGGALRPAATATSVARLGYGVAVRATPSGTALVELHVRPARVTPGTTIRAWLENAGETTLTYGEPYSIQRFEDGRWQREPNHGTFILPAYFLPPGDTSRQQEILVSDKDLDPRPFEPGLYRVSKDVSVQAPPESSFRAAVKVRATFRVVPSS